eukprot:scaffold11752_cov20-Tisochrysis_lutea.AAC.4
MVCAWLAMLQATAAATGSTATDQTWLPQARLPQATAAGHIHSLCPVAWPHRLDELCLREYFQKHSATQGCFICALLYTQNSKLLHAIDGTRSAYPTEELAKSAAEHAQHSRERAMRFVEPALDSR